MSVRMRKASAENGKAVGHRIWRLLRLGNRGGKAGRESGDVFQYADVFLIWLLWCRPLEYPGVLPDIQGSLVSFSTTVEMFFCLSKRR